MSFTLNDLAILAVHRFWGKVDIRGDYDCWNWTRFTNKKGYGNLGWQGQNARSHRIAYEITYGIIPKGLFVCHSCDNPSCCNPVHLFLDTPAGNVADRVRKGRNAEMRGEINPRAILNESQVIKIRTSTKTSAELGKLFGVSIRAIRAVRMYESWKHIL